MTTLNAVYIPIDFKTMFSEINIPQAMDFWLHIKVENNSLNWLAMHIIRCAIKQPKVRDQIIPPNID